MTSEPEATFDVTLTLTADADYPRMMRELALHAARVCGCTDDRAAAFAREVEDVLRETIARAAHTGGVAVSVRRNAGPIEVIVGAGRDARTITLEI
jgi:hypothetical protein